MLRPPVASLTLVPNGSAQMNLGGTLAAQVTVYAADGTVLTDRPVSWNTSNGQVVQIQANGLMATLKAVGAGTATVTVSAEGKTSAALNVSVTSPCCQIGEGAPTAAIQQAFQNTVTRDQLSVQLPAVSPATREGNGYVQSLLSTGTPPVPYLVAVPDGSVTGYVVAGAILSQYLALGGPAGSLGYPQSDATAGGRQMFQGGALAGSPVQLVTGAILAEWGTLGYRDGLSGIARFDGFQFPNVPRNHGKHAVISKRADCSPGDWPASWSSISGKWLDPSTIRLERRARRRIRRTHRRGAHRQRPSSTGF